ncbi:Hypothetical protein, putative [Bodo saltans]|uniref:Uncharacterized protein n=1 Tax=Bodo saltans TaxID=75058 RepID=A0A0S4JQH3_BODSA|nr:Hypothetical protein, putative [Bodo saltans]|eukprot:CUG92456.1 Hypothetical protein, putative [Bodo saltans]
MYSRLDLGDVDLPQLPPLRLRRRSSAAPKMPVIPMNQQRPATGRAKNPPKPIADHPDTPKKLNPAPPINANPRRRSILSESFSSPFSSPAVQQFIVDKPPKHMTLRCGDHYHIPVSVNNLRIEMTWDYSDPIPEIGASIFSHSGRRIGFVSSLTKNLRTDKSLLYTSSENGGREVISVSLTSLPPETSHLFVEIRTTTASKHLCDIDGAVIRVYDTSFYPGVPELLSIAMGPLIRIGTVVAFTISKERTVTKGSSVALTPNECKLVPRDNLVHLWTIIALNTVFVTRGAKQVQPELEDLAKRLLSGWTPVAKGSYEAGGDPSRIVGDRMYRMAQKAQKSSSQEEPEAGFLEKAALSVSSDESFRRDSVDTATPTDGALEEFERMFFGKGRPRIVRKNRHLYSVGKTSAVAKERQLNDDSEEDNSDDEEMFRQVFQDFASRRVIRYNDRCYNVGTAKEALFQFYLDNRDALDSRIDVVSSPRQPLIVDCVIDDRDDDAGNFGTELAIEGAKGEGVWTSGDTFPDPVNEDKTNPPTGELSQVLSDSLSHRFGSLKPPPPSTMVSMREHQEKLRQQELKARFAAPRRSIGSAGLPPPSASAAATMRQRGTSGGPSRPSLKISRPAKSPVRKRTTSARTRARQHNPFSGQLLQWIDAYMKKDGMRISPTQLSKIHASNKPPPLVEEAIAEPAPHTDPILISEEVTTPERTKSASRRRGSMVSIRDPATPMSNESRVSPTGDVQ